MKTPALTKVLATLAPQRAGLLTAATIGAFAITLGGCAHDIGDALGEPTGEQGEALMLPSSFAGTRVVTTTVAAKTTNTHKLQSGFRAGLRTIDKEERMVLSITGTTHSTHSWSCSLEVTVKSATGTTLTSFGHLCAGTDSLELLGSSDPAFSPATIEVTSNSAVSYGADYELRELVTSRGPGVNEHGTSTSTATRVATGTAFSGSIWRSEGAHYYVVSVPAGNKLTLTGSAQTMSMSGNIGVTLSPTTASTDKLSGLVGTSKTTFSKTTKFAYASDTDVYITIDNTSAYTAEYSNQFEYSFVATVAP